MSILSPIIINTSKRIIGNVPISFEYTDPITKVKLAKKSSTVFISDKEFEGNKEVILNFNTNRPSQKQLIDFIGMQSLIKTCADNAEDVKDRLVTINLHISCKSEQERINVMKMDLMKLKNRFMDFLKIDDLLKTVEVYSSNQKLKPFRKDFNTFVLDRNIYTHGQLNFLHPTSDLIIEYIDNISSKKVYAYITFEILISYNNFYKEILTLLGAFNTTRKLGSR